MQRVRLGALMAVAAACAMLTAYPGTAHTVPVDRCSLVVVGGSTAALAAALNAATEAPEMHVCLLEPTDWPGGQMTSSAVPAIDFGRQNEHRENQPKDFADMLNKLPGNPGECWVSTKCYEPALLLETAILPRIASLSNLEVFYRTVLVSANTTAADDATADGDESADPSQTTVTELRAVQRVAINTSAEWSTRLSQELEDWYSPRTSIAYNKTTLVFSGFSIVIEASEWGDLLVLGEAAWEQGFEAPTEEDTTVQDGCGQCTVLPFFVRYGSTPAFPPNPPLPPPPSYVSYSMDNFTFDQIWTYRRSSVLTGTPDLQPGDVSNQNWGVPPGNDDTFGWLFMSREATVSSATLGQWAGGINLTTLAEAEGVAYGWLDYFRQQAAVNHSHALQYLALAGDVAGTLHGLAKVPYMRESRRSVGIGGFKFSHQDAMIPTPGSPLGYKYPDRVAIGDYFYADIHHQDKTTCAYPPYLAPGQKPIEAAPFHIPLRALTNLRIGNMLVAGKTMAQTFLANAATRLHPVEWASGVAAGLAAVDMIRSGTANTIDMYNHRVLEVQILVQQYQPLDFTYFPPHNDTAVASDGRDVETDADAPTDDPAAELGSTVPLPPPPPGFMVVGYAGDWDFNASMFEMQLPKLTHVNWAFACPRPDGTIDSLNATLLAQVVSMASAYGVGVFLSAGSCNGTASFDALNANATARTVFVTMMMDAVQHFGLVGVDVDMEFPSLGTSMVNYMEMMTELADALHAQGKWLTAALVAYGQLAETILPGVLQVLDRVNVMNYDNTDGVDQSTLASQDTCMAYWSTLRGVPASKIVMGVPFYADNSAIQDDQPSFAQMLAMGADPMQDSWNNTYGYNGLPTMSKKIVWALRNQVAGVMIWELMLDAAAPYSLLDTIHAALVDAGVRKPAHHHGTPSHPRLAELASHVNTDVQLRSTSFADELLVDS